ncbi:hypothetical protein TNCV_680751 [Trichonephila clavipes]|nr:hypothetical protein TNCV_680751 [Trichonephila clavipes]
MKRLRSLLDGVETSEKEMDQTREELDELMDSNHKSRISTIRLSPSSSNDSSGTVNGNLHDRAESDLSVSLVDNGLVGPYSATVLVTLSSAPDHRPARLESAR